MLISIQLPWLLAKASWEIQSIRKCWWHGTTDLQTAYLFWTELILHKENHNSSKSYVHVATAGCLKRVYSARLHINVLRGMQKEENRNVTICLEINSKSYSWGIYAQWHPCCWSKCIHCPFLPMIYSSRIPGNPHMKNLQFGDLKKNWFPHKNAIGRWRWHDESGTAAGKDKTRESSITSGWFAHSCCTVACHDLTT